MDFKMKFWNKKKLNSKQLEDALTRDIKAVLKKYDTGSAEYIMGSEVIIKEIFESLNDEFDYRLQAENASVEVDRINITNEQKIEKLAKIIFEFTVKEFGDMPDAYIRQALKKCADTYDERYIYF